ncbi:type II toxin-antitoxin system HipA family toxin [Hydrogenophaga sp. XSHU_21]
MPERIKALEIDIAAKSAGLLARESQFVFTYKPDESGAYRGPWLSLLMNPDQASVYQTNAMLPVLDMNLPEGYLYEQIRARFPKQNITEMHLLLAVGTNSIGRNSARLPGAPARLGGPTIDRATLLNSTNSQALFPKLVDAYLASGAGVSGVQPKIMLPDRASIPVPTLIVKSGPDYYPGLSANEFIALSAAKRAGIEVSGFDLSADGGLLVLDRFDIAPDGSRLGFEDIPSLLGMQVRNKLDERKYHGSYELIADLLRNQLGLPQPELEKLFQQVAFSILVRNGDAHLKNFGVLYSSETDIHLAPMFDVLTTSIYKYTRFGTGEEIEDRTMALKLRKGDKTRTYPLAKELLDFGRRVCGVDRPHEFIQKAADAMAATLSFIRHDERVPQDLMPKLKDAWEYGFTLTKEVAAMSRPGS